MMGIVFLKLRKNKPIDMVIQKKGKNIDPCKKYFLINNGTIELVDHVLFYIIYTNSSQEFLLLLLRYEKIMNPYVGFLIEIFYSTKIFIIFKLLYTMFGFVFFNLICVFVTNHVF